MTYLSAPVLMRRLASVAVFTFASGLAAHAQQAGVTATSAVSLVSLPAFTLASSSTTDATESLAAKAGVTYSSSSDAAVEASAPEDPFSAVAPAGLQPPPRRRYGRPRYNDNSHNPDGSPKYGFEAAVGFTLPTGNMYHYFNTSYGFQVGAIRNFSKKLGVQLQFDWDEFGINGQTLSNQATVEDPEGLYGLQGQNILDGNNHIWSFTLDPTYHFYESDKAGAYGVIGVGFYHKVTNFTAPEEGFEETIIGELPIEYLATIDHYTSNAVGFNAGLGYEYKPSKFANERLFIEARYVFIDNSQRTGININNYISYLPTYNPLTGAYSASNNEFPANSNRTQYIPIKVGIRF